MRTTEKQRAVNLLRRAAKVIRKYGWIQKQLGEEECGFCALGALRFADNENFSPNYFIAEAALYRACGKLISEWNDAKRRTKRQVLGALKRAERFV